MKISTNLILMGSVSKMEMATVKMDGWKVLESISKEKDIRMHSEMTI